ncbi:MAG: hypothetical protein V1818_03825 [Candidatus Aenigmatarchaeota archaeon]
MTVSKKELEEMSLGGLEQTVNEREKFYRNIVDFVDKVSDAGERIKYEQHAWNTEIDREIKNFYGFNIVHSTGHSMMGGNSISIKKGVLPVLRLWYQIKGDLPKVEMLSSSREWENEMKYLIENSEKVIEGYRISVGKAKEMEKQNQDKTRQEYNKKQELLKKAEKIGLVKEPRSRY